MPSKLNPQEIYLLERYSSLAYFGALRDKWEEMVTHVELCLTSFMQNLPANYRSRQLPEQPDVVWGQRVLPNFRGTAQRLNTGFILLSHNDVNGLVYAHGPRNDFKGQMDYWSGWMSRPDENRYGELLNEAVTMASNICATEGAYWRPLDLTDYSDNRGPLLLPSKWPPYRINRSICVRTGKQTVHSGIYVPDVANSCAEYLSVNYKQAPAAIVLVGFEDLLHPTTHEKYGEQPVFEKKDCTWYLVERLPDLEGDQQEPNTDESRARRVPAGEECPEAGFYFTPSRPGSRRLFQKGEMMPAFDTAYGATVWQRDNEEK